MTTYEIFFILQPFSALFAEWVLAFEPFETAWRPRVVGADAYYRAATDIGLVPVRFEAGHVTAASLAWIAEEAAAARMAALDPTRLPEGDRARFYGTYLAGYAVRAGDHSSPQRALLALGRRLDLIPRDSAMPSGGPGLDGGQPQDGATVCLTPERPRVPARAGAARGKRPTADPMSVSGRLTLAEQAKVLRTHALSARSGAPAPLSADRAGARLGAAGAADGAPNTAEDPAAALGPAAPAAGAATELELVWPAAAGMVAAPSPAPARIPAAGAASAAGGKSRATTTRAPTVPGGTAAPPPGAEASGDDDDAALCARFLRGETWAPCRVRAVSLRGAHLATSGPPRVGDPVKIALGFRRHGAVATGRVTEVLTPARAAELGAAGFRVEFSNDASARARLADLLRAARTAGVALKPPPARTAVRFPVRWPIRVAAAGTELSAAALDVSSGGLFVATRDALPPEIRFVLPLESGEPPVSGRARVARQVSADMARSRGLSRGYGVQITAIAAADNHRYAAFLRRVQRRAERRVVVAAAQERSEQIARCLTSAGYAVTQTDDAGALIALADFDPNPPDAVVVDAETGPGDASWIQRAFAERHVPCVQLEGEDPAQTRALIDYLLDIAE